MNGLFPHGMGLSQSQHHALSWRMTKPSRLTVSVAEAAGMLGVSKMTITRMIKAGKLKATKIDRRVLIKLADIEATLDAHPA
jgi:excisionase family DNA binding protein